MTISAVVTAISGLLVFGAGANLGLWHILSRPDRPNYPTSGPWKRFIMFWFMAALLYRGLDIFMGSLRGVDQPLSVLLLNLTIFAFVTVMLVDHLLHWLPARTHRHIRHLLRIARCRPNGALVAARTRAMKSSTGDACPSASVVSDALVELTLQGVKVAGPNEGPEAFR